MHIHTHIHTYIFTTITFPTYLTLFVSQDSQAFIDRYNDIIQFTQDPQNWEKVEHELIDRGVSI